MSNPRADAWDAAARSRERADSLRLAREIKGLVAVEVTDGDALVRRRPQEGRCGLEVILARGRRIELSRDFDAVQLRRAVEVLEGF